MLPRGLDCSLYIIGTVTNINERLTKILFGKHILSGHILIKGVSIGMKNLRNMCLVQNHTHLKHILLALYLNHITLC